MSDPSAVTAALLQARRSLTPADDSALSLASADEAYRVQAELGRALNWFAGGVAQCWKSGGASRQAVMSHAPLPDAGVWASPAQADAWPFRLRFIEAEIALRLGCDVDAALAATLDAARAAALVDAMSVSIEVVDSRWQRGFQADALLRLADLQSHGALVLGGWVPYAARDWAAQTCRVQIGAQARQYTGTHSCGDPAWVLPAWLRHATAGGQVLAAGAVVSTGTWCGVLPAQPGDHVSVVFDGIGRAELQL